MSGFQKVRHELLMFLQYLLISFIATSVAYSRFESAQLFDSGLDRAARLDGSNINIKQMVLSMWNGYYRWWFVVFIGLSAIRVLLVFTSSRISRKRLRETITERD
jgi:hypothetical protein